MRLLRLLIANCFLAAALLTPLLVGGCQSSDTHRVTGRVTLDGQPLADATLVWLPTDAEIQLASGHTETDGSFHLVLADGTSGAFAGTYTVRITALKPGMNTSDFDEEPLETEDLQLVPDAYNTKSQIQRVVQAGDNVFDFHLKSDGSGI